MERALSLWLAEAPMSPGERRRLKGNYPALAEAFRQSRGGRGLAGYTSLVQSLSRQGLGLVVPGEPLYEAAFGPLRAKGAELPYLLYTRGDASLLKEPGLGIVGSRRASGYALRQTRAIVGQLRGAGRVLVSGGARGIDGLAHQEALKLGLPCLCVLGCGVNIAYPKEHEAMFHEIAKQGLLVSEYGPQESPRPYYFPERNRIIAQLSDPLVVTCAGIKSGSLSTAEAAMDLDHLVLCLPHPVDSPVGQGCNWLIDMGAKILAHARDIKAYL